MSYIPKPDGDLSAWNDIPAGYRFPDFQVAVDRARQNAYHRAADVDTDRFGGHADVSIFAQDTSIAAGRAGLPKDGRIHTRHRIQQTAPIAIGDILTLRGRVEPFGQSPRGRVLHCAFDFIAADDSVPLTMQADYLLPAGSTPPPTSRPTATEDPRAGLTTVGACQLTPAKVTAYSREAGNRIHFDPAFAAERGFRAPLAQGLMQVTAVMGAIVERGAPSALDLELQFRRPLFWDDRFEVLADPERRLFRCIGPSGKPSGEAVLRHCAR